MSALQVCCYIYARPRAWEKPENVPLFFIIHCDTLDFRVLTQPFLMRYTSHFVRWCRLSYTYVHKSTAVTFAFFFFFTTSSNDETVITYTFFFSERANLQWCFFYLFIFWQALLLFFMFLFSRRKLESFYWHACTGIKISGIHCYEIHCQASSLFECSWGRYINRSRYELQKKIFSCMSEHIKFPDNIRVRLYALQ